MKKMSKRGGPDAAAMGHVDDARRLALELAGMRSPLHVDPMAQGLVLDPGEVVRRLVGLWLRVQIGLRDWSQPAWGLVAVTDRRLIVRFETGELVPLRWADLVGFEPDLVGGHLLLDFGDGRRRALSGPGMPVVAVVGVAALYGVEALASHPALAPLRHPSAVPCN